MEEHLDDGIVVQDDLPTGGEQHPFRPDSGFADQSLPDLDGFAAERVDEGAHLRVALGEGQRVEDEGESGSCHATIIRAGGQATLEPDP